MWSSEKFNQICELPSRITMKKEKAKITQVKMKLETLLVI